MRKFSALANDSGHGSLPADAQAHNLKVLGSNPSPATRKTLIFQ